MNGNHAEPPDGHSSDDIASQNESILSAIEIKQEPIVKQEREDDEYFVPISQSSHTVNSVSLDSMIVGEQVDTDVCSHFRALVEVKSEEEVELVKEKANQSTCNSVDNIKMSQRNSTKRASKGSVEKVDNKNKANRVRDAKKPPEIKAKEKQHKCLSCDYVTAHRGHLNQHMLTHTGEKPFPCTVCPKQFKEKRTLQSHIRTHVDDFLFSCSTCSQGFHRSDKKMVHEADCNVRRYECHLCKEFSTFYKPNLKAHFRVHTGERPFECDQCSKKFSEAINLNRHRKTHANPRPLKFKCSVCFKNFAQQMERENHEANCKRRGYECDVCKAFKTDKKGNLVAHMRTHTGEKSFQCAKCPKRFSFKSSLNKHQKIHKYLIQ